MLKTIKIRILNYSIKRETLAIVLIDKFESTEF